MRPKRHSFAPGVVTVRAESGGIEERFTVRELWILYPAMLFALPDSLRGPLPIAPETVLQVLVLYAAVLIDFAFRRGRTTRAAIQAVPLPLWALFVGMPLAWALSGGSGAIGLYARFALWVLTVIYALYFLSSARKREWFFSMWIVLALVGAVMFLASPQRWGAPQVDLMAFQHRTGFAYFLSVPTGILAYNLFVLRMRRRRAVQAVALAMMATALLMTFSRGAWLVLYLGVVALLVYRRQRWTALGLVVTTVVALVSYAYASESLLALRIRSTWDFEVASSAFYRLDLFLASFRALPEVGLVGAGPGSVGHVLARNTSYVYPNMTSDALARGEFITDSDFVWLMIEAGPVVTAALVATLFVWAKRLYRRFRTTGQQYRDTAYSLILLVLFGAMLVFDNVLTSPYGWFLLGAGVSAVASPRERGRSGVARRIAGQSATVYSSFPRTYRRGSV